LINCNFQKLIFLINEFCVKFPPTRLAPLLRAKGYPLMLAYAFQVANALNVYVAAKDTRGAVGSLSFMNATSAMWLILHTFSRLTNDKNHKVPNGAMSRICSSLCGSSLPAFILNCLHGIAEHLRFALCFRAHELDAIRHFYEVFRRRD
jgi:hypothetical protein